MEAYETYEHAGCVVKLYPDYDAPNPYKDWIESSSLLVSTARPFSDYDFGAETHHAISERSSAVVARWLTLCEGYAAAIPFWFETHGPMMRVYLTTPDDDPAAGFVVVTPKQLTDTGARSAEELARDDFAAFQKYVAGEYVGYVVETPSGEYIDSCWSIDDEKYAREEAEASAKHYAAERLREARNNASGMSAWIRLPA